MFARSECARAVLGGTQQVKLNGKEQKKEILAAKVAKGAVAATYVVTAQLSSQIRDRESSE